MVQRNFSAFSAQRKEEGVNTLVFIEKSRAPVVAFTTLVRLSCFLPSAMLQRRRPRTPISRNLRLCQ